MNVYLGGKLLRLNPTKSIGKGGEADVFNVGQGLAAKIFKAPNHPDYTGQAHEQKAAQARLLEHQTKLREFPQNLPPRVITPRGLITNKPGTKILGYAMELKLGAEVLLRYGERSFRQGGVGNDLIVDIFSDLHETVLGTHKANVVFGDFNDLNILVINNQAFVIDADSAQFGKYLCKMFTAKFADPLLCDPKATSLALKKPHNSNSDWYSFAIMLMQSLLFVGPYGGVYRPKDKSKRMTHDARPLHRVTVFDPEVKYPRPATPFGVLPDDLLQEFHRIFVEDKRGIFPLQLLQELHWTTCSACGAEHARGTCPECSQVAPSAIKETVMIRGTVTSTRVFKTAGVIIYAAVQNAKLHWLCHENGAYFREGNRKVIPGNLDPQMRFRIQGKNTLISKTGQLIKMLPDGSTSKERVDSFGILPIFDSNSSHSYWLQGGQLMRDGQFGPKRIGDVLEGQTLFWTGDEFGFGFYRAGNLCVAFSFDAKKPGINDSIKLPPIRGQMIDSTCTFSKERAWFLIATRQGGKTINQCIIINRNGTIEAEAEAEEGDGSWLSSIRGKCAAGKFLLVATDDGIVRVEENGGQLSVTKKFPDTEPFVHSGCKLFSSQDGLCVIDQKEIRILKIK